LIFIDGLHDFEFTLFDLNGASQSITSGGFVVLDNINQPGPVSCGAGFPSLKPLGWISCGGELRSCPLRPFDRERVEIANTEFLILRAPLESLVGLRPVT
jgi:hypothetical protein